MGQWTYIAPLLLTTALGGGEWSHSLAGRSTANMSRGQLDSRAGLCAVAGNITCICLKWKPRILALTSPLYRMSYLRQTVAEEMHARGLMLPGRKRGCEHN